MERFFPVGAQSLPAVGVIGAGAWGRNILRTLHDLGALAACADIELAVRAETARQFPQVRCVADYRTLLATDLPAVAIATPAGTHYEIVRAALEAGKDVFVEKPLTLDPVQAAELRALALACGRVLMVGHITLFQPAIGWIARYLAGGALGSIHSFHQERLGFGPPRTVENALWCLGSHDVAVQLHLLQAMPDTLQTRGQCLVQADVEDDVYLHLSYPNGVQTHLHVSWAWPERRRQLTVVGSDGMLRYDELTQQVVVHRKSITHQLRASDLGTTTPFQGGGEQPLRAELVEFLRRARERQLVDPTTELAVDVVRVLAAAERQLVRQQAAWPPAAVGGALP
jgi:predicted dehydrogenase